MRIVGSLVGCPFLLFNFFNMHSKIQEAISAGLSEEDAKYILSKNPEVKKIALDILENQQGGTLYLKHNGSHPQSLFGRENYQLVGDEKLLQIMANCYDSRLDTLSGKIGWKSIYANPGIKKILLKILNPWFGRYPSNFTRQAMLKKLLM